MQTVHRSPGDDGGAGHQDDLHPLHARPPTQAAQAHDRPRQEGQGQEGGAVRHALRHGVRRHGQCRACRACRVCVTCHVSWKFVSSCHVV